MRKILYVFVLLVVLSLVLVGCTDVFDNIMPTESDISKEFTDTTETTDTTEDPIYTDTIKPLIQLDATKRTVVIKQGENYDWMDGVKGIDNLEGDVTDRIEINFNDFDANVPGTYSIFYYLSDTAGNQATPVERTVIVWPTQVLQAPPVYTGTIPDEAAKPSTPSCFGGAWYRKVVSSKDTWLGIEGTIVLPKVDINRYQGKYNTTLGFDPTAKNLDNPSIYMGGHANYESDIGLAFSLGCMDADCSTISTGSIAFRPFWRYVAFGENKDEGNYADHYNLYGVSCNGNNCYANWHPRATEYYYLPGDKLRMLVYSPEPNYLIMQIEVLEVSTLPESVAMREQYGWNQPENFISPKFYSPGYGIIPTEYKRVNAIDQRREDGSATEGDKAIPTTTVISDAVWEETYLYREINGTLYRVPFTEDRYASMLCPQAGAFTITPHNSDQGGEIITISPGVLQSQTTNQILATPYDFKRKYTLS